MTEIPCVCGKTPNAACYHHRAEALRQGHDARPPDDLVLYGVWQGPNEPAAIELDNNPGAVTAVHRDEADHEVRRWLLNWLDIETMGRAGAEAALSGGTVVLYDGDTGQPLMRLAVQP